MVVNGENGFVRWREILCLVIRDENAMCEIKLDADISILRVI